jgi:hypothetical protein
MPRFVLILTVLGLLHPALARAEDRFPFPGIVGRWVEEAKIIITWYKQDKLFFSLRILSSEEMGGRISDTTVENGRIKRNAKIRVWLADHPPVPLKSMSRIPPDTDRIRPPLIFFRVSVTSALELFEHQQHRQGRPS